MNEDFQMMLKQEQRDSEVLVCYECGDDDGYYDGLCLDCLYFDEFKEDDVEDSGD